MANLVQLKRSSVANKIPDAANVAVGEPVVNLVDKILYTKNGSNAIVVIGAGTTSNIAEGVNLYYTESRANTAIDNRVNKTFVDNLNIDADTLDGVGSASFLRSDADDASNGQLTIGNSSAYDNQGKLVVYGAGRNSLIIQTPDNAEPRGIAFRNVGGAYVSTIYVEDAGSNKANLVFGVDDSIETSVNNVIDRLKLTYDGQILFEGNTVWHAGNDGSGSGLDADTLDGIQAASFALSTDLTTANVTETTNLYYTNARVRSAFTAGDGIILESNGQIVANVVSSSVTISNTAPSTPNEGDLYFDNELLTLFVYYDDGDTQQWVEASPSASNNPFEFSQAVGGSATEIYRFDKTLYRGGKFLVTLNDTTNFKIEEVFVVHDGTNVSVSESYLQENQALIGTIDVSYTANVVGGNVILYGTANSGSPTVKGEVNLIRI